MGWTIREEGFNKENIEFYGSKYLTGNGYMGYRGTLEEYGREQLCACTLGGLYDKNGNLWREPVNMPNVLRIRTKAEGEELSVLTKEPLSHVQELDIEHGIFSRSTSWQTKSGICRITSERFVSRTRLNLLAEKYSVSTEKSTEVELEIIPDTEIWDLNGPHLEQFRTWEKGNICICTARTQEQKTGVAAGRLVRYSGPDAEGEGKKIRAILSPGEEWTVFVYGWIEKEVDGSEAEVQRIADGLAAISSEGYDKILEEHKAGWEKLWRDADVKIKGDEKMQTAVRYSLYQLMTSAPFHTDETAIPARGLSGQVYKGAMFWDTELFMLPFFISALPDAARNLVNYRVRTLEGAKRKAAEYGYRGAFYAWESQDSGDEACTKYNLTDVFTGRPLRTYFCDKQIHISADVAYGIWKYYQITGDRRFMLDGGLETFTECIRFLYDYSVYKDSRKRYELQDVTSPDEYHERNNNDAYTNILTKEMAKIMCSLWEEMENAAPELTAELKSRIFSGNEYEALRRFAELLYVPSPDSRGVIEQFEGYFGLEDVAVEELMKRKLKDTEYLGGANGIASSTQIIKQADVVLAMLLFKEKYSPAVRKANWEYYEPRTEHGSTLSACAYAIGAVDSGDRKKAYQYLEKTARTDLDGTYKLYVGGVYIGGVHTAACGGAWMVAVQGFAGLSADEACVSLSPHIPENWNSISFVTHWHGQRISVNVGKEKVSVVSDRENTEIVPLKVSGISRKIKPGEECVF